MHQDWAPVSGTSLPSLQHPAQCFKCMAEQCMIIKANQTLKFQLISSSHSKGGIFLVPMGTKLKENASFLLAIAAKATKAKTKQLGRRSEQPYDICQRKHGNQRPLEQDRIFT